MPLNARVNPNSALESIAWANKVGAFEILGYAEIEFDMALPADLALINAGGYKQLAWHAVDGEPTSSLITPAPLSAFALLFQSKTITNGVNVYDEAAEVRVALRSVAPNFCAAWVWPDALSDVVEGADDDASWSGPILTYQGTPIPPEIYIRSGLVNGVSAADGHAYFRFALAALPQVSSTALDLSIPSPCCAPPFDPSDGSHLFSQHATHRVPSLQPWPIRRLFRTKPLTGALDARVLGGPWRGHSIGSLAAGIGDWRIDAMLGGVAVTNMPSLIEIASTNVASLHTGSEHVHDGLRFYASAAAAQTQLILD